MNKRRVIVSAVIVSILIGFICVFMILKNNKTYNVIFRSDGVIIETIKVKENETISKPSDPKKDGYVFLGWQENNEIFDFATKVVRDITLDAYYQKIQEGKISYVVSFDSDGGSTIFNQLIEEGQLALKPIDPVKDGFEFLFWSLNETEFDFETVITENITLKAIYKETKKQNSKILNSKSAVGNNNSGVNKNSNSSTNTDIGKDNSSKVNNDNTNNILSVPTLTEDGFGCAEDNGHEVCSSLYVVGNVDYAEGIEVYKSTNGTGYTFLGITTKSELESVSFKLLFEAQTGENNTYKVRAYRVINGNKVYSDYSRVIEI